MDMILQTVDERISHHEKKIGRQLMEIEHKLDAKLIAINEELIDIKRTNGAQPRLSKAEDELRDVKKELEEMKFLIRTNTQPSASKDTYVQEQVNRGEYDLRPDPRAQASTAMFSDTSARTQSTKHVVPNKECDKRKQPRKPIFDDDYNITDEDMEVALFLRESYDFAEVANIGECVLKVYQLKPCVNKGFFYDQVIDAYAHISNAETATASVLTTAESRKLIQEYQGLTPKRPRSWVERIAKKFVGRRMVRVPLNVHNSHWLLLVFNFDKEEVQVLNSHQAYRDEQSERDLVLSIQSCINEAVYTGWVTTSKQINIAKWKTVCYTNIPQQKDGHSCGAYTLKYMLSWDGNDMTDYFTQALIDIFSFKICSRLLRSDCNPLRKESYKKSITKENYTASIAQDPKDAEDDITEISNPNVSEKPKEDVVMETSPPLPKRKRGRPRKVKTNTPTDTVEQEIATETPAGLADGKRIRKLSKTKTSPYTTP
ncbi:uncharacterized protein LOC124671416 [Lolium rigidum]|uniref:uncharacterized protein LOC124671416 n=1 Tax=Lolium rigidum TaxID=89674 RepID=UPI001F5DA420|nr:uncharacterized protein LOC124671416 [Lolium rigidum]